MSVASFEQQIIVQWMYFVLYLVTRMELMSSAGGKPLVTSCSLYKVIQGYQEDLEPSHKIRIHMQFIFYSHCATAYRTNI